MSTDPESLLDAIDSFYTDNNNIHVVSSKSNSKTTNPTSTDNGDSSTSTNTNNDSSRSFDPIDFLNHHYQTESSLLSALPSLRSSLTSRISKLDESISTTIQTQSDLSDLTLSDIQQTKKSIVELQSKIQTVQSKARQSEKAVQSITKEMKKLDYAKKHLSKTITALKRLHMLLHAVKQLRFCVRECIPPDYENAANLMDATFLLLGHFEGYMKSVEKMRVLKNDVEEMRVELNQGIVFGFRVVGFGVSRALEKSSDAVKEHMMMLSQKQQQQLKQQQQQDGGDMDIAVDTDILSTSIATPLPPSSLSHACHVLDALGSKYRTDFIQIFAKDHLEGYIQLFHPRNNTSAGGTEDVEKPSFKITAMSSPSSTSLSRESTNAILAGIDDPNNSMESLNPSSSNPNPSSLDQIERRYAWYRRKIREIDESYNNVFPNHWDMYYHLTFEFLKETGKHILLLFSNKEGSDKHLRDRDVENVTVLLKALQKTMLFEKEMSAWLQRDYNTQFIDNEKDHKQIMNQSSNDKSNNINDNEELEFDESGKAVSATSAEGIRIKYERQMRERRQQEDKAATAAAGLSDDNIIDYSDPSKDRVQEPVPPLLGVASTAFDRYMKPYIALEEQNMDEQLKESVSDKTVDTRGELPVFTSSTALFLYIKNSITRCTVLTKGKTLYLLYCAFQNTLRKYAKVLAGKYPSTLSGAAAAIIGGLTGGSNAVYRIPPGEEKTVCYVIDTCEYCSDTVEALQDLIADKIEEKYKSKIDMSGEQEAFQDVTAKGISVLVSGLIHRTESAFKMLSNINWSLINAVGEESKYVRAMHNEIQPFVVSVKALLPNSYFRSFCDQFATTFTNSFYTAITRCKRISESGTQLLLLDVYNLKTLLLRIPVLEPSTDSNASPGAAKSVNGATSAATIAPAIYTKMVTKQFARIETLLKLIGTPSDLLIDVFKVQWNSGSAFDLQTIMNLKGMKRNEQAAMLEKFGIDPVTAYKGAMAGTTAGVMSENIQVLQDRSSDVAAKVNSDLIQMKQKVDDFRKAFR